MKTIKNSCIHCFFDTILRLTLPLGLLHPIPAKAILAESLAGLVQ